MTNFQRFWQVASFRTSFEALLLLPEERVVQLIRFAKGERDSEPLKPFDIDETQFLAVFDSLIRISAREGLDPLLEDINNYAPASEVLQQVLQAQLAQTEEERQKSRFDANQRSLLPIVQDVEFAIDLRARPSDGPDGKLTPVTVLRLTLDEPVGGSDALVVQFPDTEIEALLGALEQIQTLRSALEAAVPSELWVKPPVGEN